MLWSLSVCVLNLSINNRNTIRFSRIPSLNMSSVGIFSYGRCFPQSVQRYDDDISFWLSQSGANIKSPAVKSLECLFFTTNIITSRFALWYIYVHEKYYLCLVRVLYRELQPNTTKKGNVIRHDIQKIFVIRDIGIPPFIIRTRKTKKFLNLAQIHQVLTALYDSQTVYLCRIL